MICSLSLDHCAGSVRAPPVRAAVCFVRWPSAIGIYDCPEWVADRHSLAKAEWLQSVCDRRVRRSRPTRQDYTSVCSAISSASSTSIPRYLTVLSSLL
jgi:hypothetical protein